MLRRAIALREDDERGVYAILFAIIVVVLFIMVAIGVDLSDARAEVRANQSRADFAALAAGAKLPNEPVAACNSAWDYLVANTPGLPPGAVSPCTSGVPQAFDPVCDASTPAVEYEALNEAPYDIVFVFPVTDDHSLLGQGGGNAEIEGDPCERFGVLISTDRAPLFGGIVSSSGLTAPASAVTRGFHGTQIDHAIAMLILDPWACNSLVVSGGALKVYAHDADNPGRISLDSLGTLGTGSDACNNSNRYTLDTGDNAGRNIWACGQAYDGDDSRCDPGGILDLFAMAPGQVGCVSGAINHACDPEDLSAGRIRPTPTRLTRRNTRSPGDHEWNCKDSYSPYQAPQGGPSIPLATCEEETPPYVDQLFAAVGTTGASSPGVLWVPIVDCNPADGTVFPPANYYVNCPAPNGFRVQPGRTVTFQGGNIVFRSHVDVQGVMNYNTANPVQDIPDGCRRPNDLCILQSSERAAYMVLRNGGTLSKNAQGSINFNHTSVFLTPGGSVNIGAGSPQVIWTAPKQRNSPNVDDPSTPDVNEASAASPFDKLALWSESTAQHTIGGQSPLQVEGVFFTPLANPFNLDGAASQLLTRAQFFTYRMNISGGNAVIRMQPDPDFVLSIPVQGFFLIR